MWVILVNHSNIIYRFESCPDYNAKRRKQMNSLLCTIVIWGGMHYATPEWMNKQVPKWMWSEYEIYIVPYGTPLSSVKKDIDPKTTGLIGFSAGGLDVLKNYNEDYAFIGLIDPSTTKAYTKVDYSSNTLMIYNDKNWGGINRSLKKVADQVNNTGGKSTSVNLGHSSIPKYFFEHYFKRTI